MSPPLPNALQQCRTLHRAILFMVPNLLELDSSNSRMNLQSDYSIDADSCDLQSMHNLKELYFDNYCFNFYDLLIGKDEGIDDNGDDDDNDNNVTSFEAMSDSTNYSNVFLFL